MKPYPSIPGSSDRKVPIGNPCVGFYKYDGSNLRWEWNRKRGFYKHGTRHRLFGVDEAPFNQAIELFKPIGEEIEKTMLKKYKGIMEFIVFTEFFGDSSFAGSHVLHEPKQLKLIDIWITRKGLIPPREFLALFGEHKWTAEAVYEGNYNTQLVSDVKSGKFPGLDEGMVCKGTTGEWMAKIKTEAYLTKLREFFGQDWTKYAE